MSPMRSDEDELTVFQTHWEVPEQREPRGDGRDGDLVHGPQTPAERAAARRRLDRLADRTDS